MADNRNWEIDFGKMILLLASLIGVTVLGALHVIAGEVVSSLYTLVVGYLAGNGVNAMRGNPTKGVLSSKNDDELEGPQ